MSYLEKSIGNDSLAEAFTTIQHSVEARVKKLLVVCAEDELESVTGLLCAPDVDIKGVHTGSAALAVSQEQYLDGIVIHREPGHMSPLRLLDELRTCTSSYQPPIILVTGRTLNSQEELELARLMRTGVVQVTHTPECLLDASVLLLHRSEADLTPSQCEILQQLRETDATLSGKKVLVVDDDVRNIFALTSLLEDHHLNVVHAENGRAGIELLNRMPDVDLVLMDIMMPGMDGYETMKAIRQLPQFRALPIIALTAKAMKGDRRKCIDAGASDYITKPVDLDQLFSVLRVWVSRGHDLVQVGATM
jgi:CheY-like chemotaxis protein